MFSRLETPSGERNTRCTMMTWWLLTTVVLSLASQQTGGKSKKKEELFSFTFTKWNVLSCPTGEVGLFEGKCWKLVCAESEFLIKLQSSCGVIFYVYFFFYRPKVSWLILNSGRKAERVFWIAHALILYKSVFFFFFLLLSFTPFFST